MADIATQLKGMSPGTLALIDKEMKENAQFASHMNLILRAKDPQKAVFEDMLRSVRTYINGQPLPDWWWWELVEEVERFCEASSHVPKPGEEGALLAQVLAALALEAATAEAAHKDLPWKVYSPKQPGVSGLAGTKYFLGIKTRDQKHLQKRHERQRLLATMTPEARAAWLKSYEDRQRHRKDASIQAKFTKWGKEGGIGIIGTVVGAVAGIVSLFAPIGTVIGAALAVGALALTAYQTQQTAVLAAKARRREMMAVQDDFESGKIDESTHNACMKQIIAEEAVKLAEEGKLPPETAEQHQSLLQEKGVTETPITITKEQAAASMTTGAPLIPVAPVPAQPMVAAENQYVVNQAGKLAAPVAADAGLATAKKEAQTQKTTATMAAAALALPLLLR